jgi:transcriptional regulator with XRE-family HTH domain
MKTNPKKAPRKVPRNAWKLPPCCLGCEAEDSFELSPVATVQDIRGEEIHYETEKYVCQECWAALMSPAQTTRSVKNAVAAYQRKHGYLTGKAVATARKKAGMSSKDFAEAAGCGLATIKRVEAGITVLSPGNEKLIRDLIAGLSADDEAMVVVLSEHYMINWDNYLQDVPETCNRIAKSFNGLLVNGHEYDPDFTNCSLPTPV